MTVDIQTSALSLVPLVDLSKGFPGDNPCKLICNINPRKIKVAIHYHQADSLNLLVACCPIDDLQTQEVGWSHMTLHVLTHTRCFKPCKSRQTLISKSIFACFEMVSYISFWGSILCISFCQYINSNLKLHIAIKYSTFDLGNYLLHDFELSTIYSPSCFK